MRTEPGLVPEMLVFAKVVELRYFAGLSELEIAELSQRSERSIRRDWQKARLFLLAAMRSD
jgi:DNA-directed RNA polymerase specialized sigma24 family protein